MMANPYLKLSFPFFSLINSFNEGRAHLDSTFRENVMRVFKVYDERAIKKKLNPKHVESVKYAFVALLDELLSTNTSPLKESWRAYPLQRVLFNEHTAGEGFFNRLDKARLNAEKPVIEMYYICLLLGFKGKYSLEGEVKRRFLKQTLQIQLKSLTIDKPAPLVLKPSREISRRSDTSRWSDVYSFYLIFSMLLLVFFVYYLSTEYQPYMY